MSWFFDLIKNSIRISKIIISVDFCVGNIAEWDIFELGVILIFYKLVE